MAKTKEESKDSIIDFSKPRAVARYFATEYEKKLRVEFKKLSRCDGVNSSFIGSCQVVLKIKKDEEDEGVKFSLWATGENEKGIEKIFKCFLLEYVTNESYERYKDLEKNSKEAFIDDILVTAEAYLKSRTVGRDYWCGSVDDNHRIENGIEQFWIWILVFDRDKLNQNLVIDTSAHSFWERLRIEWKHINVAIKKMDLCYNELFRKASLLDDFLKNYESDVNMLSSMRYEGANNTGSIISLLPEWNEEYIKLKKNYKVAMRFDSPIRLEASNYKKIRKLLEITTDELSLLMDENGDVFAIGKIKNKSQCNHCKVSFKGYLNWDYFVNNNLKISFVNMLPMIPDKIKGMGKDAERIIGKTFGEFCDIDIVKMIINEAMEQKHGTMVVFSEGAEQEAERLRNYGLRVNKVKLRKNIVSSLTSIDGALICDPFGYCYSIGTILDGEATEMADSARGARYNSALKYMSQQKKDEVNIKTLIVVVSEDGYVDFLSTEEDK